MGLVAAPNRVGGAVRQSVHCRVFRGRVSMSRSSQASPRLLAALAVAGVVSIPAVGWAAEAIEEVVVTAQRTEQSVQEPRIAQVDLG